MYIEEQYVEYSERFPSGIRAGDSGIYEAFTNDTGKLYRTCVKEYGRCIGAVRVDPDGKKVGWVFVKRTKCLDSSETYLQETWISLYDSLEKVTREQFYHYLKGQDNYRCYTQG